MIDPAYKFLKKFLNFLRVTFVPVERHELIRVLPMGLLIFTLAFNYYVLRCVKDSMLITAPHSGTEALPFAKIWVLLPMAFFLSAVFYKLSHRLSTAGLFTTIISGFLVFFFIFAVVIYPLGDAFHLHGIADRLEGVLPKGFIGLVAVVRYWSYALFYVMAELWGSMCMTVLFWGYASEVTKLGEAKRFYSLFAIGANLSGILAGHCSQACAHTKWTVAGDQFYGSLLLTLGAVIGMGLLSIITFRLFHKRVVTPRMEITQSGIDKKLEKMRSKASFWGSLAHIKRSRYLLSIAMLVVAYSIVSYLVECVWKEQVKIACPDKALYNAYFGKVTVMIGYISTFMALFTSIAIRKFGWTRVALIAPMTLILTSLLFFGLQFLPGVMIGNLAGIFGFTATSFILFFGSAQTVMSRSSKYTVFDATKEMCYIPLTKSSRMQGKAAIDGVGSRLGKSGGAAIYEVLFIISGRSISALTPWIAGVLGLVLAGWVVAVRQLGRAFGQIEQKGVEGEGALPEPEKQIV